MSILIPIVSEFNNKGFKEAEKQTSLLDKGIKRLAVTLGSALSVRKITQFSKASIRAFLEEDKAVQALATNLANLGLAYDVKPVENYIRELQFATGVADQELRPALQQLITSTKDLALSQDLLALSLDIAAGTGKSLSSVTQALGRAYLGTNTSLTRLNIGLSKADLTSKSFNEITKELTDRFSGQAAKAAQTYAGKVAILTAAAQDAQEILGEKLVKSIELLLDKDKGVPALADSFETMATNIGDAVLGLSDLINKAKSLGRLLPGGDSLSLQGFNPNIPGTQAFSFLLNRGRERAAKDQAKADMIARANAKEAGQQRSRTLVTEKKITTEKVKQNKAQIEQNKLTKASQSFNDDLISLEAALKNEQLSENEIIRLKLKKALVLENADQAEKLAKRLSESQAELTKLAQFKPANPFEAWLESLAQLNKGLSTLGMQITPSAPGGLPTPSPIVPPSILPPGQAGIIPPSITQEDLFDAFGRGSGVMASNINITVQGTGGLDAETKQAVVDAVVEASSTGISTGWFRTANRVIQ